MVCVCLLLKDSDLLEDNETVILCFVFVRYYFFHTDFNTNGCFLEVLIRKNTQRLANCIQQICLTLLILTAHEYLSFFTLFVFFAWTIVGINKLDSVMYMNNLEDLGRKKKKQKKTHILLRPQALKRTTGISK